MKKFIVFLVACILVSCSNEKRNHNDIELDLTKKTNDPALIDTLENIQLETRKECLIGDIDQIFKDDTLLFILDQHQKTIFIFSESGRYIRKVVHVGKAPGEYIAITSFCIDKKNRIIYIYDITQKKILTFNYNAQFIREAKLSTLGIIRSIGVLGNGNLVCFTPDFSGPERDGVWEIDSDGNFIKQFRKVDSKYRFGWSPYPYYSIYDGKISFYDSFTDEVYSIKNDRLTCDLTIDLKQKMPDKYLIKREGINHEGTGNYYLNDNIAENDHYYYFQFRSNKLGDVYVFLEKKTEKLFVTDKIAYEPDTRRSIQNIFSYDAHAFVGIRWGENNLNPKLLLFNIVQY